LLFIALILLNTPVASALIAKNEDQLLCGLRTFLAENSAFVHRSPLARVERRVESQDLTPQRLHYQSLVRSLLECAGGRRNVLQQQFLPEFTVPENRTFFGSLADIKCSKAFSGFDAQRLLHALQKSPIIPRNFSLKDITA